MKKPLKLLITDLDNTLYDWVTFFALSFDAMVKSLSAQTNIPAHQLLSEFKQVHQHYRNSEQPFAVLELPSIQKHFTGMSREDLFKELAEPLKTFNRTRRTHLKLYDTVSETIQRLTDSGIRVVAHTEAIAINAFYRLGLLGIADRFTRIYTLEGHVTPHPNPDWRPERLPPPDLIKEVPRSERKPNPSLLLDICRREGVSPMAACYVGDSIARDVMMAKAAGVTAVWARYGTQYDASLWRILVSVTHWSEEDVAREAELKKKAESVRPDFIIDSYAELFEIMEN